MSDEAETDDAEQELAPVTWPRVVTLKYPVMNGSERITTLTFRRGKVADFKGMKFSKELPTEQIVRIASRLCGQPTQVIDELDFEDAGEVMGIALDFFSRCLAPTSMKRSR